MTGKMLSEDELDLLASRISRTRPVDTAALEGSQIDDALASVRARIEARPASERPARAPGRAARRPAARRPAARRRIALAGAGVAVAAVASLAGFGSLTGGKTGSGLPLAVSQADAAQLHRIARAAAAQAGLAPGQWAYGKSENVEQVAVKAGDTTVVLDETYTYEGWWSGSGNRERGEGYSVSFASPQDQAAYAANKSAVDSELAKRGIALPGQSGGPTSDGPTDPGQPQPAWVTSPPSDPQALIQEIAASDAARSAGKDESAAWDIAHDPDGLWMALTSMLNVSVTSPQLRAMALEALSYVPDTKVVGGETDSLGRPGTAIVFDNPQVFNSGHNIPETETVIVDPSTAETMEHDTAGPNPSFPSGIATGRSIILKQAIVGSPTALPGGGSQPFAPGASLTTDSRSPAPAPVTSTTATTTATTSAATR